MRRWLVGLVVAALFALTSIPARAEITFRDGKLWFNGQRQEHVLGRTSFKLANIVGYHFAGRGGGHWNLGLAEQWISHNQALFGRKDVVLRVLLENQGWSRCEPPELQDDGVPQNCMFGSEPFDLGFWNVPGLRTGARPTELTGLGKQVVEWFFAASERTGVAFELVVIGTVKHDGVSVETQTHVVRQTLSYMRELQAKYPRALILANLINEWNAHSDWTLGQVNMLAVRADRCKAEDGRVVYAFRCPPGFDPEQWPGGPIVVDGGGGNTFDYDVGPEVGRFRMGLVHPSRGPGWESFPTPEQWNQLLADCRGQPCGSSESKYYVDAADEARARGWYSWQEDSGCCTTDLDRYTQFMLHQCSVVDYCSFHDEKGAESDPGWPRSTTALEVWLAKTYGGSSPPPPPPPEKLVYYDILIHSAYQMTFQRLADPAGLAAYNAWLRTCYADPKRDCFGALVDTLARSSEFVSKNTR